MKRKLLSMLLVLAMVLAILPVGAMAAENDPITKDGFTFGRAFVHGGLMVTGYENKDAAELTIPSEVDGQPVTELGGGCFMGFASLKSVTIPESVVHLWPNVFKDCTALTDVQFQGESVIDHRISGQIGTPAHIGKQQRKHRRQQHRHPQRKCHAANGADGNARKGRMPQRVREKAHVSRDHMAAQKAQQRAEHQNAQQCVFHKQHGARLRPFKGKQRHNMIPDFHYASSPPAIWNTDRNSGDDSTCSGVPWVSTVSFSSTTLST